MLFPHTETERIVLRPATAQDGPTVYEILFRLGRGWASMLDVSSRISAPDCRLLSGTP